MLSLLTILEKSELIYMMHTLKDKLNVTELRIFSLIYEQGPISRVRLSEILSLTRASLTVNTKKLILHGLIEECGKNCTNKKSRKEILLSVKADAGFVVSVHISLRYITTGIVNLKGEIIQKDRQNLDFDNPPNIILDLIVKNIMNLIKKCAICKEKILGVNIGMPGIIDKKRGIALESVIEGWKGFPIRDYLEQQLDYKVCVENDVKTLTLGEFTFSKSNHVQNLVCLWAEDGIGAGIVINGRLFRGVTYSVGEIGYSRFMFDPPRNNSILVDEKQLEWGDIISFTNIMDSVRRGLKKKWKSDLTENSTFEDFIDAVINNDPLAIHIFNLYNAMLAKVAFNLIYTFNPERLLLSGPLFNRIPDMAKIIFSHINSERAPFRVPLEAVEFSTSALGEDGITIGGSVVVMEDFFYL
jgi:glucokinase